MPIVHVVAQGECMSSLATRHGFRSYRTIHEDEANAALHDARPNANVLFPGDRVVIPDKGGKVESRATGARHRFVVDAPRTFLRIRIDASRPLAYRLVVDGGKPVWGETDGSAPIAEPIAGDANEATIALWPASWTERAEERALVVPLRLGALDPIDEIAGVQGRLLNFAFFHAVVDNEEGTPTTEAIEGFETYLGKAASGELTPELRAVLAARHGT
jgi:hypothetical protein